MHTFFIVKFSYSFLVADDDCATQAYGLVDQATVTYDLQGEDQNDDSGKLFFMFLFYLYQPSKYILHSTTERPQINDTLFTGHNKSYAGPIFTIYE